MAGLIVYEGPSALNGAPIVAIVTLTSKNRKTGNMAQVWIIPADISPVEALQIGEDDRVCGDCPHRPQGAGASLRSCYVGMKAVLGVYRAYERGSYPVAPTATLPELEGRALRIGAYGDPAAVPFRVWEGLTANTKHHTGYTHQIEHDNFDERLLSLVMVSADTEGEVPLDSTYARSFRVKTVDMPVLANEVYCPADAPKTKGRVQCIDCGLCNGARQGRNVVINVHGSGASAFVGGI